MVNGCVDFRLNPGNFGLQRNDAGLQLVERKGIEILRDERCKRIAGALGGDVVAVHCGKVDRAGGLVNNTERMTLPATMTVIEIRAPGGADMLVPARRPVPVPGPDEILIRVAAAGVNRPDIAQREGRYPPPPGASDIPGLEVAGEVAAIGPGVDPAWMGQAVCALLSGGGYAEYALAKAGHCLPVPEGMPLAEAAALPETLFTVWHNLFQRGGARAGDRVLVHGGTSGIGSMAIKLGRIFGLETIVTCGSADKCAAALALGAHHAIDYRAADFVEEVRRITDGAGVAVVLDMVGGDYLARNLDCLAIEGRHVSIAVMRGAKAELPIWTVMAKRLVLTGSTLRGRDDGFKAALAREIAETVWPHLIAGALRPAIDMSFPLAEAAAAHRRMEGGAHVGKIILQT